jgi:hypothetical protein
MQVHSIAARVAQSMLASCHHGTVHSFFADGEEYPRIWRVAVILVNKLRSGTCFERPTLSLVEEEVPFLTLEQARPEILL